ncbi:MAG: hypothetical protein H7839_22835 [Magnetococcus sp. YQC-5]
MQTAEKLSIPISSETLHRVRAPVHTGNYGSNSEVIHEELSDWMEREQHLSDLDDAISRGIDDSNAGRVQEIGTVREELRKNFMI